MQEELTRDPSLCVLHLCHNPLCVNPEHLYLGSHQDNSNDMVSANRQARLQGQTNGRTKLTAKQVMQIRRLYAAGGITQVKLGQKFGVTQEQVSNIIRGKIWSHLPFPATLPF